jgi:PAS domain S-box-containing protein
MSAIKTYSEIDFLKNKIINLGLLVGSVLSTVTYFLSLIKIKHVGFQITYVTDFIVVIAIILITIYRNRLSLIFKTLVILAGLFVVYTTDLLLFGLLSANKVVLVLIPFFGLIVFPIKKVIPIYTLAIVIYMVVGFLVITGNNNLLIGGDPRLDHINSWVINLSLLILVGTLILIAFNSFNATYKKLLDDLKQRNKIIAQNEQSYREMFNASADAIFIHDLHGDIIEVNEAMLKTYGYESGEIADLSISDCSSGIGNYNQESAAKWVKQAMEEGKVVFDWQARKKSGELFWVEVSLKRSNILGEDRLIAVVTDIDEKKKISLQLDQYRNQLERLVQERTKELELTNAELKNTNKELSTQQIELKATLEKLQNAQEKLVQSEKMASLGLLAAGVAHEINNPLNFIMGGASGLEDLIDHHNDTEIRTLLDAINEGVERATNIVSSLNQFSRQGESAMEHVNIHTILDNCLLILRNQLKNKVEVKTEYSKETPTVRGNDGKLHQAFLNLLTNAEQAIENKGVIKIKTQILNKSVVIKIEDNGEGIRKESLHKITEPFYTTKEPGKGTGLGLSITYGIIDEHQGTLNFLSEENKGTIVTVILPASNP